jgi:hypothetical protein
MYLSQFLLFCSEIFRPEANQHQQWNSLICIEFAEVNTPTLPAQSFCWDTPYGASMSLSFNVRASTTASN